MFNLYTIKSLKKKHGGGGGGEVVNPIPNYLEKKLGDDA